MLHSKCGRASSGRGLSLVAQVLEALEETVVRVQLVNGLLANGVARLAAVAREDVEHAGVLGTDVELTKVPVHSRVVVLELDVEAVEAGPVGKAAARDPVVALVRVSVPVAVQSALRSR